MNQFLVDIWSNDVYRRLIATVLILIGSSVLRWIFQWLVLSRFLDDSPYIYSVRKIAGFTLYFVAILLIFGLWVQRTGDLSVALGILGAGLAFAALVIAPAPPSCVLRVPLDTPRSSRL